MISDMHIEAGVDYMIDLDNDFMNITNRCDDDRVTEVDRMSIDIKHDKIIKTEDYFTKIEVNDRILTIDTRSIFNNADFLDIMSKNNVDFLNTIAGVSRFHRLYALDKMKETSVYLHNKYINHKIYLGEFTPKIVEKEFKTRAQNALEHHRTNTNIKSYYHTSEYVYYIRGGRIPQIDISELFIGTELLIIDGNRQPYETSQNINTILFYKNCSYFPYSSNIMTFMNCHISRDALKFMNNESYSHLIFYKCKFDIDPTLINSYVVIFANCKINNEQMNKFANSNIDYLYLIDCYYVDDIRSININRLVVNRAYRTQMTKKKEETRVAHDLGIYFNERMMVIENSNRDYPFHCEFNIYFDYELFTDEVISDVFIDKILDPNVYYFSPHDVITNFP